MKPEINDYITKNYYELLKICNKITKNDTWAGDLLNDVLLQLYEKNEINIKKLDDNSIKYYIVKCLTINWYSKTSPFYRKVRKESSLYNELFEVMDKESDDDIFNTHKLLDIMEMEWTEVNWFNKIIFQKYITMGSLKKVSIDTTIPITSIARYVNETKAIVKHNTFKRFNNE
jgi:hypothetical protein